MLKILKDKLNDILNKENVKELILDNNRIVTNFDELGLYDNIIMVDDIKFDDFILNYANKNNLYLLSNNYSYDFGFISLNDKAIKEYGLYPQNYIMPLSDGILELIGNFLDEYETYEISNSFKNRSYELYKLICEELKDGYLVLFEE